MHCLLFEKIVLPDDGWVIAAETGWKEKNNFAVVGY
jgi:hypothetical protein